MRIRLVGLLLAFLGPGLESGHGQFIEVPKAQKTLYGHRNDVYSLTFSPDGRLLVSSGEDLTPDIEERPRSITIKLWDVASGKNIVTLGVNIELACPPAFSPDGKVLVTGGEEGQLRLWDAASGKEIRAIQHQRACTTSVAFSADGKTLAAAGLGHTLQLWDAATGQKTATLRGHTLTSLVGFSPDGKLLASTNGDRTITLWDVATGQERARVETHSGRGARFSPDGKTLATTWPGKQIRLWEVATGQERATFHGHMDPVRDLAFSPDGTFLASAGKTITLWDVATRQERAIFPEHKRDVRAVAFSPDGKVLASGSAAGTIQLWNVQAILQTPRQRIDLSPQDVDRLWATLAAAEAVKAHVAVATLCGAADPAVAFLKERLRPDQPPDPQQVARWISDLDSNQLPARQRARQELEKLGDVAAPALRQRLAEKPSLETTRQLEELLAKTLLLSGERVRQWRALEVLEHIGTVDAQELLERLARGAEGSRLTDEARAAHARLARRRMRP